MILLTGSAGWIGSRFTELFCKEVIDYDLEYQQDILDYYSLLKAAQCATVVVHLAAVTGIPFSGDRPGLYYRNNVEGTANVARAYSLLKIPLIYASTDSVAMHNNHYSMSKLGGEHAVEAERIQHGLKATVVRFTNPYGPGMRENYAIPIFYRLMKQNKPITLDGGGLQTKDFVYLDDLVKTVHQFALDEGHGDLVTIGARKRSIKELAEIMKQETGSQSEIIVGEARKGETDYDPENYYQIPEYTTLEEGIKKYVNFQRDTEHV